MSSRASTRIISGVAIVEVNDNSLVLPWSLWVFSVVQGHYHSLHHLRVINHPGMHKHLRPVASFRETEALLHVPLYNCRWLHCVRAKHCNIAAFRLVLILIEP